MSENSITVKTRIEEIDVYEEDILDSMNGSVGHINVRYFLERGETTLAVADIRLYFKRKDVSLDDLTAAALAHGHRVFSQIAQHYEPTPSGISLEQLFQQ
jgi:hypothetical protein